MNLKMMLMLTAMLTRAGCGFFSSQETSPEQPKPETEGAAGADSSSGASISSSAAIAKSIPASPDAVDRIVAVVNGEIITMRQLDNRVNALMKTRQGAGLGRDEVRRKVLDALIDQELMNQAAKAKGVFITESDISQALESIKKDNNLTDEQFRASLAHSGTSLEAFREDLRVELLRNRVMGSQMVSKIVVTDKEVLDALNGKGPDLRSIGGASGGRPDNRPVRMIMLPMDPKNKGAALAQARKVKNEIEGGLSFADAAKKYSKGPGRDNGGDPGDGVTVGKLPPQLQAVLATLKPGMPTEPLEAGNAVVLVTVVGEPAPEPAEKKDQKAAADFTTEEKENVRRQLEVYKMQQRYGEWARDLKRNATIRINI